MSRLLLSLTLLSLIAGCAHDPAPSGSTACVPGAPMEGHDLNATIQVEFAEGSRPAGFSKASVWVNGQLNRGPWVVGSFLAAPGKIQVEVARDWLGGTKGGLASIEVEAAAGETVCLRYEKGLLPLFAGTLTRLPAAK